MTDNVLNNDKVSIDETCFKRILLNVVKIEKTNAKTGSKTEKKIKEEIISIIEGEVKKCY